MNLQINKEGNESQTNPTGSTDERTEREASGSATSTLWLQQTTHQPDVRRARFGELVLGKFADFGALGVEVLRGLRASSAALPTPTKSSPTKSSPAKSTTTAAKELIEYVAAPTACSVGGIRKARGGRGKYVANGVC